MKLIAALTAVLALKLSGCVTYVTGEKARVTFSPTTAVDVKAQGIPLP